MIRCTEIALVACCGSFGCVSRTEVFEDIAPAADVTCEGPLACAFPPLPELEGVTVSLGADSARITFLGLAGARDYRVYAPGDPSDVNITPQGRVVVRDAVYRCAGDRQFQERTVGNSLRGNVAGIYTRNADESVLGYVYSEDGPDRSAVHRLADPRFDADQSPGAPAIVHSRAARYVPSGPRADALLASGHRDDGVAFYVPTTGSGRHPIHFWQSAARPEQENRRLSVYFVDGPERLAFEDDPLTEVFEEELLVLDTMEPGSVPLTRVFYEGGHDHDVLAAGDAQLDRVLSQGNQPLFSLTWPGLTGPTELVVEALDQGCPFEGHLVPDLMTGDTSDAATTTLDEARWSSGEVFMNGQHDPGNRPAAIARSFVPAGPVSTETFDFFSTFDDANAWAQLSPVTSEGSSSYESSDWVVRAEQTSAHYVGALEGQLWLGLEDSRGPGRLLVGPEVDAELSLQSFLHVALSTNLPSTPRRYPVLLLEGDSQSIAVRTLGVESTALGQAVELQLAFCDGATWQPDAPCPHTDLHGRRLGDAEDDRPWAPVPVVGELAGFDYPVRLDVFASTQRVYLLLDGRPAGCGILPPGVAQPGPIRVSFGAVSNDSRSDEATLDDSAPHQYLRLHSGGRDSRRFDNLGIELRAEEPSWDFDLFPCGVEWFE